MNNKRKLIFTGLVAGATLLALSNPALAAKKTVAANTSISQKQTRDAKLLPAEFDPSKNWDVQITESDLKQEVDWTQVFLQNMNRPNTGIYYAASNSLNIGTRKGHFKAQRVFHLKAGKKYSIDFLYGTFLNKKIANCYGYINFNGNRFNASTTLVHDQLYKETVTPTEDMDYTITVEFNSPRSTNVFVMVGYDANDPNSGIIEEDAVKAPVVETPEAKTKTVKGNAVDGAEASGNQIKVYDSKDKLIGSGEINAQGKFEITTSRDLIYNEQLKVIQVDPATGLQSSPTVVTVADNTAPELTVDKTIEKDQPVIKGTTEPNATVVIKKDGKEIGRTTANGSGVINYPLPDGVELAVEDELTVVAIDEAGNESDPATVKVVDTIAPEAPTLNPVSNKDKVVKGKVKEPNLDIELKIGSDSYKGKADAEGNFTINLDKSYPAHTAIEAVAVDASKNRSPKTTAEVTGINSPVVDPVTDKDKSISGKTEPGADVIIKNGDEVIAEGTADEEGNFDIELPDGPLPGDTEIDVIAKDDHGDESDPTHVVVEDTGTTVALNDVTDKDTTVTGTAEPGDTIVVYVNESATKRRVYDKDADGNPIVADAKGNWTVDFGKTYPYGTKIEVVATDSHKHTANDETTVTHADKLEVGMDFPVVSQDNEGEFIVWRGVQEVKNGVSGATVKVRIGNDEYTGTTGKDGYVVVDFGDDANGSPVQYDIGTPIHVEVTQDGETATYDSFVHGRQPSIFNARTGSKEIRGVADPNVKLHLVYTKVNAAEGEEPYTTDVTTDAKGNYTIALPTAITMGDTIQLYQVDDEGNRLSEDGIIIVLNKLPAPAKRR